MFLMMKTTIMILAVIEKWTQIIFAIMRTKILTFLQLLMPTLDSMSAFFKTCLIIVT